MKGKKVIDVSDSNVVDFIKKKWLQMGFAHDENEENFTEITLDDLFSTYSRCFQLPELVEKLFSAVREVVAESSGGVFFTSGEVPTSLLKTFASCVCQLPYQQNFKLWQLFLDQSKDFLFQANAGIYLHGGALILMQLFSSFLCHLNIVELMSFEGNREKIRLLLQETELFLHFDPQLLALANKEIANYQVAHLILIVAYKKLRSAYNYSLDVNSSDRLVDVCCSFEFLTDHEEEKCDGQNVFLPYINADDKRISYCMIQLLTGKMLSLMGCHKYEELTEDARSCLNDLMSHVTLHVVVSMLNGNDCIWDMNISSLDEDSYKVGAVLIYVSHLPRFINFVDSKDLAKFCFALIKVMSQDQDLSQNSVQGISMYSSLLKLLMSEFFKESKILQTAFVTALWSYSRSVLRLKNKFTSDCEDDPSLAYIIMTELSCSPNRWVKHVDTTPKDGSNSMWTAIGETSHHLMELMQLLFSPVDDYNFSEHPHIFQMVNYLPLEYLSPGNQLRCLLGLSTSLVLLASSAKHLDSCKESDSLKIMQGIFDSLEHAFKAIVAIFDGVRSIWLFDHIDAMAYLCLVIQVLNFMRNTNHSRPFEWSKSLFEHLMNLSTRNVETLKKFEEYMPQLTEDMVDNSASAQAFVCLLHRLVQLLERAYLKPDFKALCESLAVQACTSIQKYIKHYRRGNQVGHQMCTSLVGCYASLLRLVKNPTTVIHQSKFKWLKYVPDVMDIALDAITTCTEDSETEVFLNFIFETVTEKETLPGVLPSDIAQRSWNAFYSLLKRKRALAKRMFKNILCKVSNAEDETNANPEHSVCFKISKSIRNRSMDMDCVNNFFEDVNTLVTFSEKEIRTLSCVLDSASGEVFEGILKEAFSGILHGSAIPSIAEMDVFSYQVTLKVVELLLESAVEEKLLHVANLLQETLMRLHFIMNRTCLSSGCLLTLMLPSLDFLTFVLGRKMKKVALPKQCVLQCLHSCIAVQLVSYIRRPVLFAAAFQAVLKVLSVLLANHLEVILPCRIAFMPCVNSLLKAVVHAGNQELMLKWNKEMQSQILLCAHNLEGLFSSMSKHKTEFQKMVPYLIADYVDLVQNVSLHPLMKSSLILGITRLLDMCSEESLRMLSVNVNYSCREIYNNLVKLYKTDRFVGQV